MRDASGFKFKIGEISEITGVNIQTIRRYDAKGILDAERDEESSYRLYDVLELTLLIRTRMYRNYGFSLDDITKLLNSGMQQNYTMFDVRKHEIEREMEHLNRLLDCIERQKTYLSQAETFTKTCELLERPEMLGIYYYDKGALLGKQDRRKVLGEWINHTPFVLPMIQLGEPYMAGKREEYRLGLCIRKEHAALFGLGGDAYSFHIPAVRCVYTMIYSKGLYVEDAYGNPNPAFIVNSAAFAHLFDYLNKNGLQICGDAFGSTFFSERKGSELHHYSHFWIPV